VRDAFLQQQPPPDDPACADIVAREAQEVARLALEMTFGLCEDGLCWDTIRTAVVASSNDAATAMVPTETVCAETAGLYSYTCIGDDYRATSTATGPPGVVRDVISNVSEQCCVDSLAFLAGSGLSAVLNGDVDAGISGPTSVPLVLCNELACRQGFSDLVGSALIHTLCAHIDAPFVAAAAAGEAPDVPAAARQRQILQVEDPGACGEDLTCATETACRYAEICYGGGDYCANAIAKDNGLACTVAKVGTGVCFDGECVTNAACVNYPAGGVCGDYGVSGSVYIMPTPLSFFQFDDEVSGGDGDDAGGDDSVVEFVEGRLELLESLMDAHFALARIMQPECRIPHLEYACATTYPACADIAALPYPPAVAAALRTDVLPAPMCRRRCEQRQSSCAASDALLEAALATAPGFPDCDLDQYGTGRFEDSSLFYVAAFEGQPVYPDTALYIFVDESGGGGDDDTAVGDGSTEESVLRTLAEYTSVDGGGADPPQRYKSYCFDVSY
jgi:hypothetical protein